MDWILIGLGAGLGSTLRYEISRRMKGQSSTPKVIGTFVVNCSGAFMLGMVVALSVNGLWWSLLADGFLGGLTTFSTFMVEGITLIRGNRKANALAYFLATITLGVLAFCLGGEFLRLITSV